MNTTARYLLETTLQRKFSTTKISRVVQTFCFGKKGDNFLCQVLVLEIKFSEEENAINQLLKKIALLFDELELEVSKNNQILKVLNISSIQKRWVELQIDILSRSQGYELDNYCKNISDVLKDEEKLIKFLNQYNMLGMLFNGKTKSDNFFTFDESKLLEGGVEIEEGTSEIEYSILWIGSKEINSVRILKN
ncbi:hypothetical protein [Capnocytophaga canis]|uniref:hypothetical protein n=1 Tax=Capnocytophaga canis TaxID=1848903 RepID=UPI0037CDD31F